jgi:hypothetical protein
MMVAFIDQERVHYGVEPICGVLPIAPSTYYWHRIRQTDPTKRSARAQRDEVLKPEIQHVYDANYQVYGAEKVWKQLRREAHPRPALSDRAADDDVGTPRRGAWRADLDHASRRRRCPAA